MHGKCLENETCSPRQCSTAMPKTETGEQCAPTLFSTIHVYIKHRAVVCELR